MTDQKVETAIAVARWDRDAEMLDVHIREIEQTLERLKTTRDRLRNGSRTVSQNMGI